MLQLRTEFQPANSFPSTSGKSIQRMAFGALAGLSATMAMTAAMRGLSKRLPYGEGYPLPPRELTERLLPASDRSLPTLTVLSHFGYGAVAGALYGALTERYQKHGIAYGLSVWAASYLGWIPGLQILKPATRHPAHRDLLMIAAHVVWGAALAAGVRELNCSTNDVFSSGPLRDADD